MLRSLMFFVFTIAFAFTMTSSVARTFQLSDKAAKKKVVLIPGYDSHGRGEHEYTGGFTLLAKALNESGGNIHAIVTEQGWPKDTTVLDDAVVIVMFSDGGNGHIVIPHMQHIDRLMKKGVGFVAIHYAVEIPKGDGGGNYFLDWLGGYFEIHWSVNPFWNAAFKSLPVHPVTSGVKPFTVEDEWYYHMRFREDMKGVTPILKVLPPSSSLNRKDGTHEGNPDVRAAVAAGAPQVMAWTYERPDGGRAFGFTGGHMHRNWGNDSFRKLVLNAIVWCAHEKVPRKGIESPTPTAAQLEALWKKAP